MKQINKENVLEIARRHMAEAQMQMIDVNKELGKRNPDMNKLYDIISDFTNEVITATDVLHDFTSLTAQLEKHEQRKNKSN